MLQVPATWPFTKELPFSKKVLFVWAAWAHCSRLPSGKLPSNVLEGAGASQEPSPTKSAGAVVAAVQPSAAVTRGVLDNKEVDMMLDSRYSISLIEEIKCCSKLFYRGNTTSSSLTLVSAAGENIPTPWVHHLAHTVGNSTSQSLRGDSSLLD